MQLTIPNTFISSIENDEEHVMHSKNHDIKITMNDDAVKLWKNFLIHLKIDIKIIWNQWKGGSVYLIMFISCIRNVIK